ncbi:MAG: glycerol-3-phosphate acyltransferase [Clostridia bacterium]|nr:glycerol-3-phosphate acyltransferase [Clostridia bacterium]
MARKLFLCALIGYLIGGINPAYVLAKIKGFDIRKHGSGNAGASNAVITMGKKFGLISALFDIFKAYASFKLAVYLFAETTFAGIVAGVSCIFGHIFPPLMRFRGGKGLACLGGVVLAFNPLVFLLLLAAELILVLIIDYICVVPITASIAFPIIYNVMEKDRIGALILGLATVVILFKHVENLKRIRNGTEIHLSFLWRRKKEIERLREKNVYDELVDRLEKDREQTED